MSKFEDIAVGDFVYIVKSISPGWANTNCFFIPCKVTRVTKTMFLAGDNRCYKKNGYIIGAKISWHKVYKLGEKTSCNGIVVDQTNKYQLYKHHINAVKYTHKLLEEINERVTFKTDTSQIFIKLKEIETLLNTQKEIY